MTEPITVETHVAASFDTARNACADPEAITKWKFTVPEWQRSSEKTGSRPCRNHKAQMEAPVACHAIIDNYMFRVRGSKP